MSNFYNQLKVKIILGFLLVLLIPTAITSVYMITRARTLAVEKAAASMLDSVESNGKLIRSLINESIGDTLQLAQSKEIRSFLARPNLTDTDSEFRESVKGITRFMQNYPDRYTEISVVDEQGVERISVKRLRGKIKVVHNLFQSTEAKQEYFIEAMSLTNTESLSIPVYLTPTKTLEQNQILYASPIFNNNLKPVGIITLRENATHLISILKQHNHNNHFSLLDENKDILFADSATQLKPQSHSQIEYTRLSETLYKTPFNPDSMIAYCKIRPPGNHTARWVLVSERSSKSILREIDNSQKIFLITMASSVVIALFIAFTLTGRITRPIHELALAAAAFRSDNKTTPITRRTKITELADLTDSFNHMLGELSSTYNNLNSKVGELRQSKHSLQQSEKRYREVLDAANDLVFVQDFQGKLIDVNQYACIRLGYTRQQLLSKSIKDLEVYLDSQGNITEKVQSKEFRGKLFESIYRTHSGDVFHCEVNACVMEYEQDTVVMSIVRDITSRKEAQANLDEERERLNITLKSIDDGVITTNKYGEVVLMNQAAEGLTGHSQDDIMGKPLAEILKVYSNKNNTPISNLFDRFCFEAKSNENENLKLISVKGNEYLISISGSPLKTNDDIEGVVVVFRDVTDKRLLEKQMAQSQKAESLSIMAGGIAHDFNNLLGVIVGNISLAQLEDLQGGDTRGFLKEAMNASNRAKQMTQQLLTFSKGGALAKKTSSVKEIVKEAAKFTLHGSSIVCDFNFEAGEHNADVDSTQISQVINNLILNATQAMPNGGTIHTSIEKRNLSLINKYSLPEAEYILIRVKDTGSGIPEDLLAKVFDPYFTTKKTGNGLGLASCYSIIKKHGGIMDVNSEEGKGTEFQVYLPASENNEDLSATKKIEIPAKGSGKILLMDDDLGIRKIGASILESCGYNPILATKGEEALETYQRELDKGTPYDAVILDLTIPGAMGGEETMKKLLEINPNITAIVTSGYGDDPIMSEYKNHGFAGCLKKPFDAAELTHLIRDLLTEPKKSKKGFFVKE